MITWLEPVIRGGMNFNAATYFFSTATADVPRGASTTAWTEAQTQDETATTNSNSASYLATWEATIYTGTGVADTATTTSSSFESASGSTINVGKIGAQTSTTTSFTARSVTTCETIVETTRWSTVTKETTDNDLEFKFVTTTESVSDKSTSYFTSTRTEYSTTTLEEVVANVCDTVVLCDFSEIAMVQTQYTPLAGWDGKGIFAQHTSTGSRATITADVQNTNISLLNVANTNTYTQAEQKTTTGVTWSIFASEYSTLTRYIFDTRKLLSQTETTEELQLTVESTSMEQSFGLPSFTHVGDTRTEFVFGVAPTTQLAMLDNGQSYPELAVGVLPGEPEYTFSKQVTVGGGFAFETGSPLDENGETVGITITANGNTTYVDNNHLQLKCFPRPGNAGGRYDNLIPGLCYIVKPFGIYNEETVGAYATIAETSFSDVDYLACLSRQVPFINFDSPRALRTITTSSNDSFTISGNSITYTVTGDDKTKSEQIMVAGPPQTGIIATKNVLGGAPESFATFYQSAPNGVFSIINSTGWTTTCMDGGTTSATYGNQLETSALDAVPYLTLIGQEPLIFGNQIIPAYTYERYE